MPCVAVMDLHGGRPLPADYGGRSAAQRQRECPVHYVDEDLFDSRPGLAVLQVGWGARVLLAKRVRASAPAARSAGGAACTVAISTAFSCHRTLSHVACWLPFGSASCTIRLLANARVT